MFANVTPKAIALGTASGLVMIAMAMGVEITKAQLFEIRKSTAALEEAKASNKAAEAQVLDAMNKLKGTLETAAAMNNVGQMQAHAVIAASRYAAEAAMRSAQTTGEKLVEATNINMLPEIQTYQSLTGPLFAEPTKRIDGLNNKIVRLRREAESGIDGRTRRSLSESERADRIAQKEVLDEELETVKETSSKTFNDALGLFFGCALGGASNTGGIFGQLSGTSKEPAATRRIIQEP